MTIGKIKTNQQFITDAIAIHGYKYDYSKIVYVNSYTQIEIICHKLDKNNKKHGSFWQTPNNHLNGRGCKLCDKENHGKQNIFTTEQFISKANIKHNFRYKYEKTNYKNSKTKITITCLIHGDFEQRPTYHLLGKEGCHKCACNNLKLINENFVKEIKSIYGDKYDYSKTKYEHSKTKVEIICNKHGSFLKRPWDLLNGSGCPNCNESKGEAEIAKFLIKSDIKFERQKFIDGCKNKRNLPFDFYLPDYNILIEFDGILHYKPLNIFGMSEEQAIFAFNGTSNNDLLKNKYCLIHHINLIRIPYWDIKNIEKILINKLCSLNVCFTEY
jgi:hypothetical protein